jgi:type VI secretion system protein ImpF
MAELTPKERLQPSLLDRLTDNEPDRNVEGREQRVLSPARLRESVRRDLSWLFNPDLSGKTSSTVHGPTLERVLRQAIWEFEPRLLRKSVRVKLVQDRESYTHNAITILIEAELWAQPIPLRLFLRTDVDLETGQVKVSETGGGG